MLWRDRAALPSTGMHASHQPIFISANFAHLTSLTLTGAARLPGRGNTEGSIRGQREARGIVAGVAGAGGGAGAGSSAGARDSAGARGDAGSRVRLRNTSPGRRL